jgi:phosphoribosylaminoimidazolecarboxamide formyltransferase / IMP cyclohydrolase
MQGQWGTESLPDRWVQSFSPRMDLRYGENPHQKGAFFGSLGAGFRQLQGKELSYNNLADAAAACDLLDEFSTIRPTAVVVKHTNACGVARAETLLAAWEKALACDPVSAFGGVIALNHPVDAQTAESLNELFFEVLLAPGFDPSALNILSVKKNRILVVRQAGNRPAWQVKSVFEGLLVQESDSARIDREQCRVVTDRNPTEAEWESMLFANILVKHTKSNTIVLARGETLLASGTGQTSRVDALKQAIQKAGEFGFDLTGAAMASDAFFPFPDCVEIAAKAGLSAVIQPGGSIRDADSIEACNQLGLAMVTTGTRHFKH